MGYPRKLLNDYETLALDLHPHWWYFAESVFALIVTVALGIVAMAMDAPAWIKWVLLAAIIASAAWVLLTYLRWVTTYFVITSDRVIFRHGIIAKSGIEIPLERVNSVHFDQGIFERIVGAGDLLIESGALEGQQRFTDVRNPDRVQNLIHSQMEENERRARTGGAQPTAGGSLEMVTQLEKLEALRDRGSISHEDFEIQKRRLLDG